MVTAVTGSLIIALVTQSGNPAPHCGGVPAANAPSVFNRLQVPLGVHWHGIELASYFDGVPGFSGAPGRTMPAMQPGDSFAVQMTPPRAGTFIYHIHSEQFDELNSGLYGPLIVLEPAQPWAPERDHIFVISNGGPGDSHKTIFVNGSDDAGAYRNEGRCDAPSAFHRNSRERRVPR